LSIPAGGFVLDRPHNCVVSMRESGRRCGSAWRSAAERGKMRRRAALITLLAVTVFLPAVIWSQPPDSVLTEPVSVRPPSEFRAFDTPGDHAESLTLEWSLSPDDGAGANNVVGYRILRSESGGGEFTVLSDVPAGQSEYIDRGVAEKASYLYRLMALAPGGMSVAVSAGPAVPVQNWFNRDRANLLVIAIILILAITYFIYLSTTGRDMDNVQTVAGVTILGHIAKRTATYETQLEVPVSRSITMSVGRETVKQAYLEAGRPDLYNDDMVHYVTDEQFGYVAAVDGIMVRERPAACFYLGAFFAESLILAETGNSIGAIQVAGTAMPTQLPFFVAACDYTLIGEELFAASAYLTEDKKMKGSLKGQDAGKAIAMVFIIAGVGLGTLAVVTGIGALQSAYEFILGLFSLN
jgi:hypothetical protein